MKDVIMSKHENGTTSRSVSNSIAAGYIAGVTGTILGHPLDSAKVWLQTGRRSFAVSSASTALQQQPLQVTTTATTRLFTNQTIIRQKSTLSLDSRRAHQLPRISTSQQPKHSIKSSLNLIRALYAGVSGPLITVGLVQSINFAVYDSMRRALYADSSNGSSYLYHDSLGNIALASMTAGAVTACITNPLMLIKTVQQTNRMSYRQAIHHILAGRPTAPATWRNFYTGFAPHCVCEMGGRGLYFVLYESLKRHLAKDYNKTNTISERMISAATAGIACWSVIFPIDVIRCRMFASGSSSVTETIQSLGNWRALYRGYGVTLLRAGPVAAIVLPVYDIALEQLNNKR